MVKCTKCGDRVCKSKARFYENPLKWLCNNCRQKELDKIMEDKVGIGTVSPNPAVLKI